MVITSIKILIIEDDPGIYTLLKRKLEKESYQVKICTRGDDAISLLSQEHIDLILLDYILPDKTANEIIDILHEKKISTPFIITTGQGSEKIAVDLMKKGALDYVIKDIHFWDFIIPAIKRSTEKLQTEKRLSKTEFALKESESRLRQIIDLVPYFIYAKSSTGKIIFANKSYLESSDIDENGYEDLTETEKSVLQNRAIKELDEEEFFDKNKKRYIVKSSYIPYSDYNTNENCVLSILIDITHQKWIEEEIKSLNTELEKRVQIRTNELEQKTRELIKLDRAKDDILNIVAHDLRSPLMSIMGNAQLVNLKSLLSTESSKLLNNIDMSCKKMDNLITDLLDVSKIESEHYKLELEPVNLNSLIQEIQPFFSSLLKQKSLSLEINFSNETNNTFMLNKDRFWQLIQNLISNAIKFTNPGGKITVRIDNNGQESYLIISDTGIGIPKNNLDVLFDKFTPVSRKGTHGEYSTGLGMSICKRIVELHNGQIRVKSEVGLGTEFIIVLPKNRSFSAL